MFTLFTNYVRSPSVTVLMFAMAAAVIAVAAVV
jgi:hypothetical protein